MDPYFGFPAVMESRATEDARNRNRAEERRLSTQVTDLENELNATTLRIIQQKNHIYELKHLIKPNKNVVCPSGFSEEERQTFRKIRRASSPSMSLEQFDKQMAEFRTKECVKRKKEIVRRFRRKLKIQQNSSDPSLSSIVQQSATAALLKHKNKMNDALERSESSDIRIQDQNQEYERMTSSRRNSSFLPSLTDKTSLVAIPRKHIKGFNPGRRHTIMSLDSQTEDAINLTPRLDRKPTNPILTGTLRRERTEMEGLLNDLHMRSLL